MWKQSFGLKLKYYLLLEHKIDTQSDRQVYKHIQKSFAKYGIWIKVAILCGATEKNVHDYYHNTWSKQFCDSHEEHKEWLTAEIQKLVDVDASISIAIDSVIQSLQAQHPHKKFHMISLRQVLWRIYHKSCRIKEIALLIQTNKQQQIQTAVKHSYIKTPNFGQLVLSELDITYLVTQLKDFIL
ncbi:Conserved_hypothetical protein [Hexamita inflata]|uniref:Uncharacterized protein n=1 Tax=Hexamita inflata TaxID=28002 RepID=A0ABP1KJJ1_9EUKA